MTATVNKPSRTIRWDNVNRNAFTIREVKSSRRTVVDQYTIREFGSAMGRAFHLVKMTSPPVAHDVLLNADPRQCRCDCLGHERYGYCRHVDGLRALLSR
jgi:hypothetical protein